jgi:hypothetical protein
MEQIKKIPDYVFVNKSCVGNYMDNAVFKIHFCLNR